MRPLPRDLTQVIGWPANDLVTKERSGKWVPRFQSVIKGGKRSGTKAQAAEDCIINVLSRLADNHPVFDSGRGLELKDDVIARRDGNPPPRGHGARASILSGVEYGVGGRIVAKSNTSVGVSFFEVNERALADLENASDGELAGYAAAFAEDARADAPSAKVYLREQRLTRARILNASQRAYAREMRWRSKRALTRKWRILSMRSGWWALEKEILKVECPEAAFFGSPECPVFETVDASYRGSIKTAPRSSHDGDLRLYRAACGDEGFALVILKRIPLLQQRIIHYKNKTGAAARAKLIAYVKVLKYLIKHSQVDHIWSSASDHPRNCYLEFDIINNLFSDYKNQPGKLAHYGKIAKRVSTRWMTASIEAESRVVRVF